MLTRLWIIHLKDNLLGSHNFYPQQYTGLGYDYFVQTSEQYRQYGINTAAFVSSNDATYGPWPMQDGYVPLKIIGVTDCGTSSTFENDGADRRRFNW